MYPSQADRGEALDPAYSDLRKSTGIRAGAFSTAGLSRPLCIGPRESAQRRMRFTELPESSWSNDFLSRFFSYGDAANGWGTSLDGFTASREVRK
jgi:hypothetical protein